MKALVAEDEPGIRALLSDFLIERGYEVKTAGNGVELVRLAFLERPDLVLTDLHMPEMAGDTMLAMIDAYPELAGIPVIVITGATRSELADMGIPREIPILGKPIDFDLVAAELKKIEDRREKTPG